MKGWAAMPVGDTTSSYIVTFRRDVTATARNETCSDNESEI